MIRDLYDNAIRDQQLQIGLSGRSESDVPLLPFDPNAPPDVVTDQLVIAPNYIDNSDFDFSKDGYINSPMVGGDDAEELYNFYRQRFIKVTDVVVSGSPTATINAASAPFSSSYSYPMNFVLLNGKTGGEALSGTLTRVSDTQATLSVNAENDITDGVLWFGTALAESSTNAIKASSHSTFATETANTIIPRWDKTNGWVELGSNTADRFDVATPLPVNFIRGGITYYFRGIVAKRSGASLGDPIRLSIGIWDATSGQDRFLESSNFDLSVAVVGTTGSTTYSYVVLGDLDDGTTIISDVVTITNGNATLSASNYNRLTWQNKTGILRFRIYRETGGVAKRVFTITNGGGDYNDYGTDEGETLGSLPTASVVRPIAYKVTEGTFNPGDTGWIPVLIPIEIPSTYNTSNTTGKQWLRIGVEGAAGDARLILLDRIMLSVSDGGWQRSARDFNRILNQNPSSLPTETDQGDTGIGRCFPLDTLILVCDADGTNIREMPIGEVDKGMFVVAGSRKINRVQDILPGVSSALTTIVLSNGVTIRCTPSERFITSRADHNGTPISSLTLGDEIMCWNNGRVEKATIECYVTAPESVDIRTLVLHPGHLFVVGVQNGLGAIAHNRKADVDLILL